MFSMYFFSQNTMVLLVSSQNLTRKSQNQKTAKNMVFCFYRFPGSFYDKTNRTIVFYVKKYIENMCRMFGNCCLTVLKCESNKYVGAKKTCFLKRGRVKSLCRPGFGAYFRVFSGNTSIQESGAGFQGLWEIRTSLIYIKVVL